MNSRIGMLEVSMLEADLDAIRREITDARIAENCMRANELQTNLRLEGRNLRGNSKAT